MTPENPAPLAFRSILDFPRGTLLGLLRDAYAFDARYERRFLADWQACDDFFYEHPAIAAKYGFVTALDGEAVGFLVWDPRRLPDWAELGHNCIVARCKGRGYGSAQLREALSRIRAFGARRVMVTTNDDLLPAQRAYERVGFVPVRRHPVTEPGRPETEHIDYELLL